MCRRQYKAWHQEADIAKKSEVLSEEVCDAMALVREFRKLTEELSKVEKRHQVTEKKKCKKGHLFRCEGRA